MNNDGQTTWAHDEIMNNTSFCFLTTLEDDVSLPTCPFLEACSLFSLRLFLFFILFLKDEESNNQIPGFCFLNIWRKRKERKNYYSCITKELKLTLALCIYVSTLNVYLKVIKTLIIRTDQDSRIKGYQGHNKKVFVFTSLHNNHSAQRSSKVCHLV